MATKNITLELPEAIYNRYKQRAEQMQRSVEDEMLDAIANAAPEEGISPELKAEIETLKLLNDDDLWKAARKRLPVKSAKKAEQLHFKQQRNGRESLTTTELQFLKDWLYHYDRHVLLRSHVLLLLKERGHDITPLLQIA